MMNKNATTQRGCPLTGGAPIRMTRGAFDRCCAERKATALEEQKKNHHLTRASGFAFARPCLTCQGPPAELTIITVDQVQCPPRQARVKTATETPPIAAPWNGAKKAGTDHVENIDHATFLRNGYQWLPIGRLCLAFNQRFGESQTEQTLCQLLIRHRVVRAEGSPSVGG